MKESNEKPTVIDDYKKAKNEELNKPHIIKEYRGKTDRYATCKVYTDGSAKGSGQSRDERSFAGWGVYFKNILQGGRVIDGTKYGNLYNSDPLEAELRAALEALKFNDYPSHFELVTDCADVVEGIINIHEKVADYHKLNSNKLSSETSNTDQKNFRYLRIWKQINDEIYSNPNIVSLQVRWVRSHSLDKYGTNLPDLNDFSDPKERLIVEDCLGNEKADKCANRGAIKSVKSSLYFFINVPQSDAERSRSLITSRKNFMNSRFARDEAVRFLSEQPKDFLPKDVIESIFDTQVIDSINHARSEIAKGKNPSDVFKSVLRSQEILAFSESNNTQDFMDRCRQQTDRENESSMTG